CGDRHATPHGRGADLCSPLCLFTLVGIAGEDDLDAPDLISPSQPVSGLSRRASQGNGRLDSKSSGLAARTPLARPQQPALVAIKARMLSAASLDIAASAHLCDVMLVELNDIGSEDEATK